MAIKDVLDNIIADIKATKEQGFENISADKLITYLENLKKTEDFDHDVQMELLRSNNTASLEMAKMEHASNLEMFRSVISAGANASKAFMLMNGGAAIALLAFLGNIWNKELTSTAPSSIAFSLLIFCIGILCSGLCVACTYLAQYCYSTYGNNKNGGWYKGGNISNSIAILTGLASLILFIIGAYLAYLSMGVQFGNYESFLLTEQIAPNMV